MTQFYCLILVPETGEATPPQPLLDANEPWKARAEAASRYLKLRSQRDAIAGPSLLSDPAWDMLLDLFVGHITGRDVSVTSACVASRRPATTSLRYIERMAKQGLIRREKDCNDNRKVYLRMTEKAFRAVAKWIDALRDELITA
ncbi:MAG: hypothetical protein A2792_12935 [Sphingomonadales bacterium RIFCSPHIGHO2_01_FULL_65_20]|jgi:hypothetical protein|uniref:MarR family transcriptional regulator n=2 Tax=Sphingomonadaceae TaxID=41297 RepID=A0A7V8REF0_9SPHN|nr:hypothetical protein [Sphingomonas ursincola]MBA4780471.1 hypothetical protein [Blastomonas sp.]OHC94657.1 MAG: hypothetical protein A2792_12935 [Sphingomonadales bacterium RIFCSPHIGHO2_01_FULL_65_20]MBA1374898.1 hypothetical protein [Sphingomonas ursincola]MBY0621383.1 hypothetical protein [Sphingomonas ursincola]MCH2236361.1 hypothetical protein [Blastomonas sp.]